MPANPIRIIRQPAVAAMLGVSEETVRRWVRVDRFPAPLQLGPRAIGWEVSAVESFIEAKRNKARLQSVAA